MPDEAPQYMDVCPMCLGNDIRIIEQSWSGLGKQWELSLFCRGCKTEWDDFIDG